jgi:hypothetical protein
MDFTKKPVTFFIFTSIILLISYIFVFTNKTNVFPVSETFCWISSTIIALLIVNSLYQAEKYFGNGTSIYTIIIYILLIGCALCSLGTVWNASVIPDIKLKF